MKQNKLVYFVLLLVAIAILFGNSKGSVKEINANPDLYLQSEIDFTITSEIQQIADQISASSDDSFEAIKNTARYVYQTIQYKGDVTIDYCYDETAQDVLDAGYGDCVSMSRLNVALLRAQGIPARTAGGCLSYQTTCNVLFSVVPGAEIPKPEVIDDLKKRGFLHEWVEVYDEQRGWLIVEATAGLVLDNSCGKYIYYGYDDNAKDRCVINDLSFFNTCKVA